MLRQHKYLLLFSLSLFFAPCAAFAQPDKELPTESVDVISDFDARLLESNKVDVTPSLPPLDTSIQRQTYTLPPRPLTVTYEGPKLRPIGMKSVKAEDANNGFAKLGGGVPTALIGELGYYLGTMEKFDARFQLRHHSLSADRALENQKFFNTNFLASSNIAVTENIAVEGRLGYNFERVHFYGYDHEALSFTDEDVRQDFRVFDLGARLYNSERNDLDLNYSIAPKFYRLLDYYSNSENGFDIGLTGTKWFAEKHPLRLTIRTDFTRFEDTAVQTLNNIYLQPSFTYHTDFFKIKVGGNFVSNRDVFTPFPDLELTLRLFGDGAQIFGGATGDLRKNTYRSLSDYNPFLQIRGTKLRNTRMDHYYGGLRGNLGWLEYSGQAGFIKAGGLALFQTQFTDEGITRFGIIYDTATIVNVQGTVKLTPIRSLVLTGTLSNNVYEMENETAPWGLPRLEGNFQAVYTLLDGKAALRSALYIADGIPRRDENNRAARGDALLDLNVGGNYYFTDNIGVFLDINNLLNNKRERWYDYPMVGLNFLAGVTARF
jgi:hypothetical protein